MNDPEQMHSVLIHLCIHLKNYQTFIATMPSTDLQSKEHRDLLDIIDQLRSQGVGRYVDLPEIIVCGDQSAGKSSVLEAISGMSFPTKDGVCTRFATELVLRRDATTSVKVSIHPADDRDQEEKEALLNWRPEMPLGSDGTGLGEVIEAAKMAMGLSVTKLFCNDLLRVELSGPTQPHLTMVDLPGLFRAGNKQQSADNVDMVKDMVTRYMNRPRSIILAVVSAKNEYVLQDVAEMAKKADPEGLRTMGLITKPDTLYSGSDSERDWIKIAMNEEVPLSLGWHVLKNRSYEERGFSSAERDAVEEDFFSHGIWASIKSSHCGVKSLKPRLSSVLKNQILQQLPDLIEDVESSIQDCNHGLDRLGGPRETPEQQRRYLLSLSQEFSTLMSAAVQGHYTHDFFGNTKKFTNIKNRLRAVVQNQLTEFADTMRTHGEDRVIVDSDNDEVFHEGERRIRRAEYIEEVVTPRMRSSRGCELPGLFNPLIPSDLFILQCRPWQGIVQALIQELLAAVNDTIGQIIEYSAANEVVREVMELLGAELEKLESDLKKVIQDLLAQHRELHAITYNSQLTENVQEMRNARARRIAQRKIRELFGPKHLNDPESKIYVNPSQVIDLIVEEIEPSMDHFGGSTIVDYMQAYYKASKISP